MDTGLVGNLEKNPYEVLFCRCGLQFFSPQDVLILKQFFQSHVILAHYLKISAKAPAVDLLGLNKKNQALLFFFVGVPQETCIFLKEH